MSSLVATIGLEVHVQLSTQTKAFCACSTAYAGADPNAFTCPVCLGHPGVLPVFNQEVAKRAAQVVLAFGGRVSTTSRFDRKNYFYPDMPKAYQISQFFHPIGKGGTIRAQLDSDRWVEVGIERVHIEEDAGKLSHQPGGAGSLVDLNRAGVPLLEIVSRPEIHAPEEAYAYLRELKTILEYLEVSDCNMEDGSLRCDANCSLAAPGAPLGTRVEIKNLNSFRGVEKALAYELERQRAVLEEGRTLTQETRLWDEAAGRTRSMRSKEESEDYRYFPDPDLPWVVLPEAEVEAYRSALPELPEAKRQRYRRELGLSPYDAGVLTQERARAQFFEASLVSYPDLDPKQVCNWLTSELLGRLKDRTLDSIPFGPPDFAKLLLLLEGQEIHATQAKTLLEKMLETGTDPAVLKEQLGFQNLSTPEVLDGWIREVLDACPAQVQQYLEGKTKVAGFLVGQVMKASQGSADPRAVRERLEEVLGEL